MGTGTVWRLPGHRGGGKGISVDSRALSSSVSERWGGGESGKIRGCSLSKETERRN